MSTMQTPPQEERKPEIPCLRQLLAHASARGALAVIALCAVTALSACGEHATLPASAGTGPHPTLPAAHETFLPTIRFAHAVGWPAGAHPEAAPGLAVSKYADALQHPRWLKIMPNGDVLVAETNEPSKSTDGGGLGPWIESHVMDYIGAGGASPDRITLLRGLGTDGRYEKRSVFLKNLHSPFGMAFVAPFLYVANTDAIVRFPYRVGDTEINVQGTKILDLPAGSLDGHWTRDLIASPDGARLYVTVGSNSNIGEKGLENEAGRAAIYELDLASGRARIIATGLRNPNGLAWEPRSGKLWVAVNERDELGSDLVPDYMTSVQDGGFYGWPYSYYGQHVDSRVRPHRPDLVASAIAPDYALGAHTASLGLAFYTASLLPEHYRGGAFIGQHGSWNRNPRSGYKVVFVPFSDGHPSGPLEDVLTGFLSPSGDAYGRPVGVAPDPSGALLVADDVGNVIWRITAR